MKSPTFLPSQDPEGFNRKEFHEDLQNTILDFLLRSFLTISILYIFETSKATRKHF